MLYVRKSDLLYLLTDLLSAIINIFFSELSNSLNHEALKYDDNLLVIGNLNIDTLIKKKDNGNYFSDPCDSFSLKNLMTDITCVRSISGSSTD